MGARCALLVFGAAWHAETKQKQELRVRGGSEEDCTAHATKTLAPLGFFPPTTFSCQKDSTDLPFTPFQAGLVLWVGTSMYDVEACARAVHL
jgi:hypothetical protein